MASTCFTTPSCLNWTIEDVEVWIKSIKLPQYKCCMSQNFIDGRKLILLTASNLTQIGVKDFEHIKTITREVRQLLEVEEPYWNVSIADERVLPRTQFIEQKSRTGVKIDALTPYEYHCRGFTLLTEGDVQT